MQRERCRRLQRLANAQRGFPRGHREDGEDRTGRGLIVTTALHRTLLSVCPDSAHQHGKYHCQHGI
jgi:hypothetical protein